MKGRFGLIDKFKEVGLSNCFISEITLAELKFGVQNSQQIDKNTETLSKFLSDLLLIGATAVANQLTMITNNVGEFSRIKNINIEDWTKEA